MDKLNRLMADTDAIAADIAALRARASASGRATALTGTAADGVTVFGSIHASGDAACVIAFEGGACEVKLGDSTVYSGASPALIALSAGAAGTLSLSGERGGARALLFGAVRKTN